MTPSEVRRRYSNGRDFEVVLRNGYRNRGIWARHSEGELALEDYNHWALGGVVTVQEERPSLVVRCDTLQERQRIADTI